MKAFYHQILG